MQPQTDPSRRDHFTFRGNLRNTRYGWLRLTPAYSVHLVADILDTVDLGDGGVVLDPFGGTGTTALVCAERASWPIRSTSTRSSCGWHRPSAAGTRPRS
jgi:hypothetical protein